MFGSVKRGRSDWRGPLVALGVPRRRPSLAACAVSSPNEFIASSLTLLTRANELEVPSHPGPIPNRGGAMAVPPGIIRTCVYTRVRSLRGRERVYVRGLVKRGTRGRQRRRSTGASYVYKVG